MTDIQVKNLCSMARGLSLYLTEMMHEVESEMERRIKEADKGVTEYM